METKVYCINCSKEFTIQRERGETELHVKCPHCKSFNYITIQNEEAIVRESIRSKLIRYLESIDDEEFEANMDEKCPSYIGLSDKYCENNCSECWDKILDEELE